MALPMLDEEEWAQIAPLLHGSLQNIKTHRECYEIPLDATPIQAMYWPALILYGELTGFRETNPSALWHHRLSLYGPACERCGKPLRTPQATLCAACGLIRGATGHK
jgi:hypothetical protein